MTANSSPKITYYKTRDNLQINQLPFFFGWVEFEGDKITGEHYKPKIDKTTNAYLIGYYKIKGDAADFLQTFEKHSLIEITQAEFNGLMSQWTEGRKQIPICWGSGLTWEIAKPT